MLFSKQIEKLYQKVICQRADDKGDVFYFSYKDFPGLISFNHDFLTSKANKLSGSFYYYEKSANQRLVIFEHGMGGGHRSYMKEIELLASHGYLVYSYDHTGCMNSQGSSIGGFCQSLVDLDHCLNDLKNISQLNGYDISVIGHSWGGYSTLNILVYHREISHIVAISGFRSVETIINQHFKGIMKFLRKPILDLERKNNPDYVDADASISLVDTVSKALIIQSSDDPDVSFKDNFLVLKDSLSSNKNINFLQCSNKKHNPNYMIDAIAYKKDFLDNLNKKRKNHELDSDQQKKAFIASYDWKRMTMQDPNIWQEIFNFLDN